MLFSQTLTKNQYYLITRRH